MLIHSPYVIDKQHPHGSFILCKNPAGYGDLTPTHTISKVFTCIYALSGFACLGLALGVLGNNLVDSREKVVREAEAVCKYDALTLFDVPPNEESTAATAVESSYTTTMRTCLANDSQARRFMANLVIVVCLASLIGYCSGWDVLSTIYYLIITGCTIGYGDLTPKTQTEKVLAIIFIPFAVGITGHWLGFFASHIIERRCSQFRHQYYGARELTQDDLDVMDVNCDGKVTRTEFLEFMLLALNKIDYELVKELEDCFNRLDVEGTGELSRDNLVHSARRKLKSPRRKLELAAYKRRLLNQAAEAEAEKKKRNDGGAQVSFHNYRLKVSRININEV
jgi:potassium channel subfamily K